LYQKLYLGNTQEQKCLHHKEQVSLLREKL